MWVTMVTCPAGKLVFFLSFSPALAREVLVYATLSQWDRWHERCGSARQLPQLGRCHLNLKHPLAAFFFSSPACTGTFPTPCFLVFCVKKANKIAKWLHFFPKQWIKRLGFLVSYGITCVVCVVSPLIAPDLSWTSFRSAQAQRQTHPRHQCRSTGASVYVCARVWEKKCESSYTQ